MENIVFLWLVANTQANQIVVMWSKGLLTRFSVAQKQPWKCYNAAISLSFRCWILTELWQVTSELLSSVKISIGFSRVKILLWYLRFRWLEPSLLHLQKLIRRNCYFFWITTDTLPEKMHFCWVLAFSILSKSTILEFYPKLWQIILKYFDIPLAVLESIKARKKQLELYSEGSRVSPTQFRHRIGPITLLQSEKSSISRLSTC